MELSGVFVFSRLTSVLVRPANLTYCLTGISGNCIDPDIQIKHRINKTGISNFWMENNFVTKIKLK